MASSESAAFGQHDAKLPAGESSHIITISITAPSPLLGGLTFPPSGLSSGPGEVQQAVRFASVNQEIEPEQSLQPFDTAESSEGPNTQVLSPETQAELQRLSTTLQNVRLQERRMSNFTFEPVSLPVSRVSGRLLYRAAHSYNTVHSRSSFVLIKDPSPFLKVKKGHLMSWLRP